jgi:hypothetical protein
MDTSEEKGRLPAAAAVDQRVEALPLPRLESNPVGAKSEPPLAPEEGVLVVAPNSEVPVVLVPAAGVAAPKREKPPPAGAEPVVLVEGAPPKSEVVPAGVLAVPNNPPPEEAAGVPKDDPNEKLPSPLIMKCRGGR